MSAEPTTPPWRSKYHDVPLLELVPMLSPHLKPPTHLPDFVNAFERASCGEPVRAMCSFPIRSWKTVTLVHGVIRCMAKDPTTRVIVMTNVHGRAEQLGRMIRELADQTDFGPEKGWNTIVHWQNKYAGGVTCMSSDQSKLGLDCHLLVCDDPLDDVMTRTKDKRDLVDEHISHYTMRGLRDGRKCPVIIVMSRWDQDDPIGRRLDRKAENWEYFHTPGIVNAGTPEERSFCEAIWPLKLLRDEMRIEAETDPTCRRFFAQIMGEPKAPGREEFGIPGRYTVLPEWPGFKDGIGIDMSYTTTAKADQFALFVGRVYGRDLFIRYAVRLHADMIVMEREILKVWERFGRLPIFTYYSGPELGAIQGMHTRGIPINGIPARFNKDIRAQPMRVAWNAGRIMWPTGTQYDPAIRRIRAYAGAEGDWDDELDALVSLYMGMAVGGGGGVPSAFGTRRL